ncbi:MAG: hypothetical protein PHD48_11830 [Alphaproteobacteria bacterium]|nr:hypothetical protein [Alphaproteobacteria bacterium]
MTNDNMYMALAFQNIVANNKIKTKDAAPKILILAKQMKEFCEIYAPQAFTQGFQSFIDDNGTLRIDDTIRIYIKELREKGSTILPQDRQSLIQLYDRLEQRKSRRGHEQFYATVSESKVANLVLKLLDEEIEDFDAMGVQ